MAAVMLDAPQFASRYLWFDQLSRRNYELLARNRGYFGEFDPFDDFDLIFGVAKLNLKIVDVPIRYAERTYGETNIARWRLGWLLIRMVMFACRRIKIV